MAKPVRMTAGLYKGVLTEPEPYSSPNVLTDAKNGYLPNPPEPTAFYSRPGIVALNGGAAVYAPATAFRAQAIYTHEMLDGSRINFCVIGGHLFRIGRSFDFTDVTPVGVTISASITTRAFFASLLDNLIAHDGINRPWIGTNLTSTPITATYIDYDGAGVSWTAFGKPQVYLGAVFFILNAVNGVSRRADVSSSEPGLPAIGYQQSGYDDNITLSTSNSAAIFAISSRNTGLFYLRQQSIGSIAGSDIGNLASSPTEDAIAFNVGTQAAQTLVQFGDAEFFLDAVGRPYVWTPGSPPRDIWKQFRSVINANTIAYPATTAIVATATLEPTLNKYLCAIWSPEPASQAAPTQLFVFDAPTGTYEGYWQFEQDGELLGLECVGTIVDSSGRPTLLLLTTGGFAWSLTSLIASPSLLTTEGGVILTTEGGVDLTTEGVAAVWQDNGEIPDIFAETCKFGEDGNVNWFVDMVTVETLNPGPVRVTTQASMSPSEVEGEPTPSTSQDGTYRLVVGADAFGRGPSVRVKPLTADEQFMLGKVSVKAIPSLAGADDA